jgi:hypothetical protein
VGLPQWDRDGTNDSLPKRTEPMNATTAATTSFFRIARVALLLTLAFAASAVQAKDPPKWAAELRSGKSLCTQAAEEAKAKAIASGIDESRMSWLYGRKPFDDVGHVSLVIDGWIVVDNGGLGANLWGDTICPGSVCTVKEAQRGYDESFMESAALAVKGDFTPSMWKEKIRVAKSGR